MGGSGTGTSINTVNNGRTGTANIAGSKTGVAINTFNNDGTFNIKLMNLVMPNNSTQMHGPPSHSGNYTVPVVTHITNNVIERDNNHNINILNEKNDGTHNPMMYINTVSNFDLPKGELIKDPTQQYILFM